MAWWNRFVIHKPREHDLWVPQSGEGLVGVEAIGCDEATIVRLGDETEQIREVVEADAGPLHDTARVRRTALQEKRVGDGRQ